MRRDLLSATTIQKDTIRDLNGEKIGTIKELMVDTSSGSIAYAVLSFGGMLGLGDKYFAVPWSAFEIDKHNHEIIFNTTKVRLENAPGFDKDQWPNFADPAFTQFIDKHYEEFIGDGVRTATEDDHLKQSKAS